MNMLFLPRKLYEAFPFTWDVQGVSLKEKETGEHEAHQGKITLQILF